jgi:hypothetical protein
MKVKWSFSTFVIVLVCKYLWTFLQLFQGLEISKKFCFFVTHTELFQSILFLGLVLLFPTLKNQVHPIENCLVRTNQRVSTQMFSDVWFWIYIKGKNFPAFLYNSVHGITRKCTSRSCFQKNDNRNRYLHNTIYIYAYSFHRGAPRQGRSLLSFL